MICLRVLVLIIILMISAQPVVSATEQSSQEFQYLLFNSGQFNLTTAETATESLNAVSKHFGGLADSQVKVGVSANFSYFHQNISVVKQHLRNFLAASASVNLPVLIKLDGEQWWGNRPDLWNWWDPTQPGYAPKNCRNVEWTSWNCDDAMKIAWRNWGRQIRVLPPPNLMSPAFRQASHEAMGLLLPIIMEWRQSLPKDKTYLFIGINVGWESSIGVNAYYYPNGNDYLDKPRENDPSDGIDRLDIPSRGLVQSGYAALRTAGIRMEGQITEEDMVEVVRRHLTDLSRFVYEFGFPREKIFTHVFGNEDGELLIDAAVNAYSCPGWSTYWYADDLTQDTGIMRNIETLNAPYWAAVEWLLLRPQHQMEQWTQAFVNTLCMPNCKFLSLYNWQSIQSPDSKVIDAARAAIIQLNAKK